MGDLIIVVLVIALLGAAAALATPPGRLPLALRGVYRIMRKDRGESAAPPDSGPAPPDMETVEILGCRAKVAHTFCERARGLIGVKGLAPGEGMLIERCNAIHTFFMSFSIDATFLDAENRVVKIVRNIRPWRPLVWGGWRAKKVLETEARIRPFG